MLSVLILKIPLLAMVIASSDISMADKLELECSELCIESSNTELDCGGLQLDGFTVCESWSTSGITVLKLNNNQLTEIPDLSKFINLQQLDLSYNRITQLPETALEGLFELRSLNIEMNKGLILSEHSVTSKVFGGNFGKLKTLRLKQSVQPSEGVDYSFLSPLYETLEELYITGTPALSPVLMHFSRLHTLSLGGSGCNIPSLNEQTYRSLMLLPSLQRLSARNCNCSEITTNFLQDLAPTLQKFDLSCNPLRDAFGNITKGLNNGALRVLLLDNINRVPAQGFSQCPWTIPEEELRALKSLPLNIFSFHSNQLEDYGNLKLQDYAPGLTYLDVSYNNLRGYTNLDSVLRGDGQTNHNSSLWHHVTYQPLGLRYIGLRGLTSSPQCGPPSEIKLDCNKDSYLFIEDNFYWDVNYEPDIVDLRLLWNLQKAYRKSDYPLATLFRCIGSMRNMKACFLEDIRRSFSLAQCLNPKLGGINNCLTLYDKLTIFNCGSNELCLINYLNSRPAILKCAAKVIDSFDKPSIALNQCYSNVSWLLNDTSECFPLVKSALPKLDFIGCLVEELIDFSQKRRDEGLVTAPDDHLNETVHTLVNIDFERRRPLMFNLTEDPINAPPNLTTFDLGENNFWAASASSFSKDYLNNRVFYRNNVQTIDFSRCEIGFIQARNFSGLIYLTNITLNNAIFKGWDKSLFFDSPVKYFHLSGVKGIAQLIQDDNQQRPFNGWPGIEVLDISSTGVNYFSNSQLFVDLHNLTHLYLQNNNVKEWNLTISGNVRLKTLDIRRNKISHIVEHFRNEMDEQFTRRQIRVYLEGNDADCSNCNNTYIAWLKKSDAVADRHRIRCKNGRLITKPCDARNWTTSSYTPSSPSISDSEIAAVVIGLCVILGLVALFLIVFNNRYVIIFRLTQRNKPIESDEETRSLRTSVYCCHSEDVSESILGLIDEMATDGIDLLSHHLHLPPGALVKTSIAKMMAQSSKVLLFLSADYLNLDLSHFELDMLRLRSPDDLVVVTVNVDLAAKLDKLPQNATDVLLENRQLEFPLGICSGGDANFRAFLNMLRVKLDDQPHNSTSNL